MLIAVAGIDLEHRIIPNKVLLPCAVFAVGDRGRAAPGRAARAAASPAPARSSSSCSRALAYPAGMGMGDVKLAGVMGLFLGAAVIPALFVAFLAGTLVGVAVIAQARRRAAARRAFRSARSWRSAASSDCSRAAT